MPSNLVIPYWKLRRLRKQREQREEWSFMQAQDESYLNFVLHNPQFAMYMCGVLQAAYDGMHWTNQNIYGHNWEISFTTGKKCPGLRVATLQHPRLNIIVREQNPTKDTWMAREKRNGKLVFQVFVDDQPACYLIEGEHIYEQVNQLRASS